MHQDDCPTCNSRNSGSSNGYIRNSENDNNIRRIAQEEAQKAAKRGIENSDFKNTIINMLNSLVWKEKIQQEVENQASKHVPTRVSTEANRVIPNLVNNECNRLAPSIIRHHLLANSTIVDSATTEMTIRFTEHQKRLLQEMVTNPADIVGKTLQDAVLQKADQTILDCQAKVDTSVNSMKNSFDNLKKEQKTELDKLSVLTLVSLGLNVGLLAAFIHSKL